LHATDTIQRDIELILERYDFYYERRKNYYKNIGRPPARFVTPLFVAAGYIAIVMKDPATGAALRSRFMRNQASYEQVFSNRTPIEIWPRIVAILKAAEGHMLLSARQGKGNYGEGFLRSWRGLVGLLGAAKLIGRFDFNQTDLLTLPVADIDDALVGDCWEFLKPRRKGAVRPNRPFVKELCNEFAQVHSLTGVDSVGGIAPVAVELGKEALPTLSR
jgi:hypothetical protein